MTIRKLIVLTSITAVLSIALVAVPNGSLVGAISASDWRAGRIIDDVVFFNKNAMSVSQIQNFLSSKVPICDTNGTQLTSRWNSAAGRYYTRAEWGAQVGNPAPFTCLKDYRENPSTHQSNYSNPSANIPGSISAAQIIYNAAQQYNINPQVFLVMLQKEQGLITDDWPYQRQYTYAMGANCPDTPSGCDPAYSGFATQVNRAGYLYNYYKNNINQFNFNVGNNYILWNVTSSGCGGSGVYIENIATAMLYIYTPYQPNTASLNAFPGQGDGCSSYGNRNFWFYFNNWFGSTYSDDTFIAHPDGALIEMNFAIFLIENGQRHHIRTPEIFNSYGYLWSDVKKATIGDRNLAEGYPIDKVRPGVLFRSPSSSVYVMAQDGSSWKKQLVTFQAFNGLGYKWDEVLVIPNNQIPAPTHSQNLTGDRHPSGSLVRLNNNPRVYLVDSSSLRHIPNAETFSSYRYPWSYVKNATTLDSGLSIGANVPYREGSVLFDSTNIFIVDYNSSLAQTKRPIAPWECFSDRLNYSLAESIRLQPSALPPITGPIIYC